MFKTKAILLLGQLAQVTNLFKEKRFIHHDYTSKKAPEFESTKKLELDKLGQRIDGLKRADLLNLGRGEEEIERKDKLDKIDQDSFEQILDDDGIELENGEVITLAELHNEEVQKLVQFAQESEDKDNNFDLIIEKIKEEEIKAFHLTPISIRVIADHFVNDKKSLKILFSLCATTPRLTQYAIDGCKDNVYFQKQILEAIPEENQKAYFQSFETDTLATLIVRLGEKEIVDKITDKQKAGLLNSEIAPKTKKEFFADLIGQGNHNLELEISIIEEMIKYTREQNPILFHRAILEDLSEKQVKSFGPTTLKYLAEFTKNQKDPSSKNIRAWLKALTKPTTEAAVAPATPEREAPVTTPYSDNPATSATVAPDVPAASSIVAPEVPTAGGPVKPIIPTPEAPVTPAPTEGSATVVEPATTPAPTPTPDKKLETTPSPKYEALPRSIKTRLEADFGDSFEFSNKKEDQFASKLQLQKEPYPTFYLNKKDEKILLTYKSYYTGDTQEFELEKNYEQIYRTINLENTKIRKQIDDHKRFFHGLDKMKQKAKLRDSVDDLSQEDWLKKCGRVEHFNIYENILTTHPFDLETSAVAATLAKIAKKGLSVHNILTISGTYKGSAEKFKIRYQELEEKNDRNPEEQLEFRNMYQILIGANKIWHLLSMAELLETQKQSTAEKYAHLIEGMPTASQAVEGNFYNIESLSANQSPEKDTGEIRIALSGKTINEFADSYKEIIGEELPEEERELNILQTIFRSDTFEELVAKKVIEKVPGTDEFQGLVISRLPAYLTTPNEQQKEILTSLYERYGKETLVEQEDRPWGWDLDRPSTEEVEEQAARKTQLALGNDEALRKTLLEGVQKDIREDVDSTGWLELGGSGAAGVHEPRTMRYQGDYTHTIDFLNETNAEAFVSQLMDKPTVEIVEGGKRKTIKIWHREGASVIFDRENLQKYLNYLIKKGQEFKANQKDQEVKQQSPKIIEEKEVEITEDEKLKKFIKSGKKEDFENLANHEELSKLLTRTPFGLKEDEVVKSIHAFLKKHKKFTGEDIYKAFELNKKFNPSQSTSFENFKKQYLEISKKYAEVIKMEDSKEKEDELIKINPEYQKYRIYAQQIALLMHRFEQLGKDEQIAPVELDEIVREGFKPEQIRSIREGYLAELKRDKARQQLEFEKADWSKNPKIQELQKKAVEMGYPLIDISEIENRLIAGAFIGVETTGEDAELTNFALAGVLDLGNGLKLAVIGDPVDKSGAVAISFRLFKTEDGQTGSMAIALKGGKEGGSTFLGYLHNFPTDGAWDIGLFVGAMLGTSWDGSVSGSLSAGVSFTYNQERKQIEILQQKRQGLEEIDKIPDASGKIAALKKHHLYQDIAEHLDDADLLSIYQTQVETNTLESLKESKPFIKQFGFGLAYVPGAPYPIPFAALEIVLGQTTLVKPKRGEYEKIAKALSQAKITEQLRDQLSEQIKSEEIEVKFFTKFPPFIYQAKDGRYGILDTQYTKESIMQLTQTPIDNLNIIREQLKEQELNMSVDSNKIGEKDVLEFRLLPIPGARKDIDVYVDPESGIDLILTPEGKIRLSEVPDNLVIASETFQMSYELAEGQSTSSEIIIFTTNPNFDRQKVISQSQKFIEQRWENNATTKLQVEKRSVYGKSHIFEAEEYDENNYRDFEVRQETFAGFKIEDVKSIASSSERIKKALQGKTFEELYRAPVREGLKETTEELYKEMKKLLESGAIEIGNAPLVVSKFNELLEAKGQEPLQNGRETNLVYTYLLHQYYINIWRTTDKEAIMRRFEQHSKRLVEEVYVPKFLESFASIGYTNLEGKGDIQNIDYARLLAEQYLVSTSRKALESFFEKYKTKEEIEKALETGEATVPMLQNFLIGTGTTDRQTHKGIHADTVYNFTFEGIPQMGTLGESIEWNPKSTDPKERDLAKVTLETMSPRPWLSKPETFFSALALKWASFEATGFAIGAKNYEKIADFYELPEEKQNEIFANLDKTENQDFKEALTRFSTFLETIRAKQLKGGYQKIKVNPHVTINIKQYLAKSGAYALCGNLLLMALEDFSLKLEDGGKSIRIQAAKSIERQHQGSELRQYSLSAVIGASVAPKEEEVPPPPDEKVGEAGPSATPSQPAKKPGDGATEAPTATPPIPTSTEPGV